MAKLTTEKILLHLDGLSLNEQGELLVELKQRLVDNLSKAQSEAEEKASELQSKINSLTASH